MWGWLGNDARMLAARASYGYQEDGYP